MEIMQIVSCLELMPNLFIFIHNGGILKLLYSPHLKMVLFFLGYESLSKGYNVLNEFYVSVSHEVLSHAMVADKVLW